MKKQISIRINGNTINQIEELRDRYNMLQTEVITIAVNDYYEKMKRRHKYIKPKDPAQ